MRGYLAPTRSEPAKNYNEYLNVRGASMSRLTSVVVIVFLSSKLAAQNSEMRESAKPAKTNSQNEAHGDTFISDIAKNNAEVVLSQALKIDFEQDHTRSVASVPPDAEAQPDERGTVMRVSVNSKKYIIGPMDVLRITVWREQQLSGQFSVSPDGKISMPLIDEVEATGLTSDQLATSIKDNLSKYILNPLVTVEVQEVNSKKYFVQGEVQRPGAYRLVVPTTVLEALGNAGGFREFANTKHILILRGAQQLKFNYKSVTSGKDLEQNVLLQSGDQIIVR